jgi:phage-related protein
MEEKKYRVVFLAEAKSFIKSCDQAVKDKFVRYINYVEGGIVKKEFFKKLSGTNIWEFRVKEANNIYRLLAFMDNAEKPTWVICTHGFQKKSQATPAKEIKRAVDMMNEYMEYKSS